MLQLRFVGSEKPPVWLVEETYIIGSGAGCHIHLADPSVAAQHAELSVIDERVTIGPVADGAVLLVNGSQVSGPTHLTHDTQLQIGEYHLRIVDPKRERPVVNPPETTSASSWGLQSKSTALANKLFPVAKDMIVGRSRECDLCLAVAHLSRRHARLFFDAGALWVEDLNSANGTFLNGRRVERARLRAGDELAFDTLVFVVRGEAVTAPESPEDKTSLRPALNADIRAPKAPAREAKVSRQTQESAEPQKPALDSGDKVETPGGYNAVFLWCGVFAVIALTVLAIFYFAA
jgi:FOG: FHA domain